ncbi:T9SS type A sorting domain-containing protein, partial [Lutibacter sp.]|uniref:T9SS type A sorting domain-containing protein n=1 Tax=Lutibacter sp. TaxID=1925666 RepID=UPI003563CEF2
ISLEKGIYVYMNNAISELEFNKIVDTDIKGITLFNYLGQHIKNWNSEFSNRRFSLPLNEAAGVYIVKIATTNGVITKKIVVE